MYMGHMIKASISSYLVLKRNTMSSSAPDMQVKDSSPMGVDWALV